MLRCILFDEPEPGVRTCMRCGWLFVSPDPSLVRRCARCRAVEDEHSVRCCERVLADVPVRLLFSPKDN